MMGNSESVEERAKKFCDGYFNAECTQRSVEAMAAFAQSETASLRAENERLEDANDKMHDALHEIEQWSKAYPLKAFPEPSKADWAEIAKVLRAAGFSLDCISASNMRHVVTRVGEIAQTALRGDENE